MKQASLIAWTCALAFLNAYIFSFANEPTLTRSIIDRARMATHVVIGVAEKMEIINKDGTKTAKKHADLLRGEQFELVVKVKEVMYADSSRNVQVGGKLKVRFGKKGLTYEVYKKALLGKTLVYWLSQDAEHCSEDYFYPFFGETNLVDLIEKSEEAKVAVAKLQEATDN